MKLMSIQHMGLPPFHLMMFIGKVSHVFYDWMVLYVAMYRSDSVFKIN